MIKNFTAAICVSITALVPGWFGSAPSVSHANRTVHALPVVAGAVRVLWPDGHESVVGGNKSVPGRAPAGVGNNLYTGGGSVLHNTHVYLTYYGSDWGAGFTWSVPNTSSKTVNNYSDYQVRTYMESYFRQVGATSWRAADTQYCDNVPKDTIYCSGQTGAHFLENNHDVLAGTWVDATQIPPFVEDTLGVQTIAQEGARAVDHFGYDPNGEYFVLLPPHTLSGEYAAVYCAYHGDARDSAGREFYYASLPFVPDIPSTAVADCGRNKVNLTNDAFGHGAFDGFSMVGGHEFEEAETDPHVESGGGFRDSGGAENADKCAHRDTGQGRAANMKGNAGQYFAVQAIWSNEFNGGSGNCVTSYP